MNESFNLPAILSGEEKKFQMTRILMEIPKCTSIESYAEFVEMEKGDEIGFVHTIMSGGWTKSARKPFKKEKSEKTKCSQRKNKPWYIYIVKIVFTVFYLRQRLI